MRSFFLFAICGSATVSVAQVITNFADSARNSHPVYTQAKPKGPKPISHELSFGLRLNTDGWSIFSDIGRVKQKDTRHPDMFYNVRFWQFEFTEKKDPKEYKITVQGNNNKYIFGKIYNYYALKFGRGYTKLIAGKPDDHSVSIHWIGAAGLAIGFQKPYYLNTSGDPSAIKYSDETKSRFLDQQVIEGSAGFGKGLSEVKIIPGGHIKTGLHFDFSANTKTLIGVETGFNFEYYSQQVQLMANVSPTPYFADMYVSLQVGKRR